MQGKTILANVDEYIATQPDEVAQILKDLRQLILATAPGAIEGMSYGMAGYKISGKPLVYFGAFKNHIGFFATPAMHSAFAKELAAFKQGKGSVQFPLNKPMPMALIKKMVTAKIQEIEKKVKPGK